MSAADKLAQVLAEHELFYDRIVAEYECDCGATFEGPSEDAEEQHRSHMAAVVLAHLTAEGWAQGREEFAVKDGDEVDEIEPPTRDWAERVAAATNAHLRRNGMEGESTVVRRRVTDWEPAETGDQE